MSPVVISGGIYMHQRVQAVLHRVVRDSLPIQIIADGIAVAEDIDILVLPEVHGHIGGIEPCKLFREKNPEEHVEDNIPPVPLVLGQLREAAMMLFIVFQHPFKEPSGLHPILQLLEVDGHPAQQQGSLPSFALGKRQLLQKGHIHMIISMAYINPILHRPISKHAGQNHPLW